MTCDFPSFLEVLVAKLRYCKPRLCLTFLSLRSQHQEVGEPAPVVTQRDIRSFGFLTLFDHKTQPSLICSDIYEAFRNIRFGSSIVAVYVIILA